MPFAPGKSGNPGGRPKAYPEVKELARKYTVQAIKKLAECMEKGDPRTAVAAANALLDRGWGRPTQAVELTGKEGGPIDVSTSAKAKLLAGLVPEFTGEGETEKDQQPDGDRGGESTT